MSAPPAPSPSPCGRGLPSLMSQARAHHHLAEDLHRQAEIGQEIGRLNVATALLEKCANLARQLGGNFGSFLQVCAVRLANLSAYRS